MVASDPHGLRRYQTGDLFLCKGFVRGLPDLAFVRRRDLEYSFTGEKLTAEQVGAALGRLREEYAELGDDGYLACVPSQPAGDPVPHYKLVLVGGDCAGTQVPAEELAARCDELLGEVNREYKGKRSGGRLGPVRFARARPGDFARRVGGSRRGDGWEAQFKFLPLYRNTWESLEERNLEERNAASLTPPRGAASGANRSSENPARG